MARRKKRQSAPPRSGWNRTLETLEQRLVMSAAPLMTHHGMGAGFDEIPALGHHAIVDEPAMTHHAIIDEPGLSHHALPDEPGLSHHDLGPAIGTGVIEASPAVDPEADFWLDRDLLDEADLGEKISQTLREAHGLTGQDEVLSKYGFDGAGQTVVVIDSGIAHSHTALGGGYGPGHRIVGGWDFTENDADFYDDGPEGSHGTHVAGIIGAEGTTHSGVATGVDLVGLRVFDDAGNGYFSWVEDALQWTVANVGTFEHDITAVNLSLGTYWNSDSNPSWAMLEDEFAALEAAGVFISVSAGNDFTDFNAKGVSYPASSDHVIPVMSVDNNGNLSYFSQRAEYAIAAPGRAITSTVPDYAANDGDTIDDDWQSKSGTSMAAPYVAGSSVLVREAMEFVGMTDIDQWDIYDHMMATADTFYDSATDTNYQRLNLEAAIDALMPEDDFGSSVETAHNLGTLNDSSQANPLGSLSGVISTLDDADYFTFTAGSTGTVTFSASESHALDGTWDAWGGAWSTTHNGDCVIDVVAGQTYTVSLSTADGLGYYDLNFDLESTFAAIDWGAVAAQETRSGLNVSGEAWYSVTAGRTGYLTAETLPAAGSATVEVYDAQQNLVGSAGSRVDVDALVGEQFMLRVVGDSADLDLRLTNAVTLSGSSVSVIGTDGDDTLGFVAGAASHSVSLNGVVYSFASSQTDTFSIDGSGGADRVTLTGGAETEQANLGASQAILAGDTYSATATSYISVDAYLSGDDEASLLDSVGDDSFTGWSDRAVMIHAGGIELTAWGAASVTATSTSGDDTATLHDTDGDDSYRSYSDRAYLLGDGYANYTFGFGVTYAYATSGNDMARYHDSAGDDRFRGYHDRGVMSGDGYVNYGFGFDVTYAYGTQGDDSAIFYDSAGDDDYRGNGNWTTMTGAGYRNYAVGFDTTHAYSTTGNDTARFDDTNGDDRYRGYANHAYMAGDGYLNYAVGFEATYAYAEVGNDTAKLHDSAGDDLFRAYSDIVYLSGDGFANYASGFNITYAYSTTGDDVARFHDTAGDDRYVGYSDRAFMAGDGYSNTAFGFNRTYAYATDGNDVAKFFDSLGDDYFQALPDRAYMSGSGFLNYSVGFDNNFAYSSGGSDRAHFYDSSGNDVFAVDPAAASMAGSGYRNVATGFGDVTGYASQGNDRAELNDSSDSDWLTALGSLASVAGPAYAAEADGFDHVVAESSQGGADQKNVGAVDFVFEQLGGWA